MSKIKIETQPDMHIQATKVFYNPDLRLALITDFTIQHRKKAALISMDDAEKFIQFRESIPRSKWLSLPDGKQESEHGFDVVVPYDDKVICFGIIAHIDLTDCHIVNILKEQPAKNE